MTTWIIVGVIALLLLFVVAMYNGLVTLKNRVEEAMSDMDVQLKRRYDLIPNLVETVKGYASHEQGTLEKSNRRLVTQRWQFLAQMWNTKFRQKIIYLHP